MHVVIFEGSLWTDFLPLTLTRPVFSMRCGATTLLEKQIRSTKPSRLSLWVRPEMVPYVQRNVLPTLSVPTTINQPLDDEPALLLAGRTLHLAPFEEPTAYCVVSEDDALTRLAYVKSPGLSHDDIVQRSPRWKDIAGLPQAMQQTRFPRNWADLISWNEELLVCDSIHWTSGAPTGTRADLINSDDIYVKGDVSLGAHVVLDASKGPIMLGAGVAIGAGSVIEGPCHLGELTRVAPQSLIRSGTSAGSNCRLGGEIGNSIFYSYSNKSHYGFVGDSVVGSWVNLGAGTTTSNLKSTYGLIKLRVGDKQVQSDRVLLGCAIGDHSKTATNSMLQAGGYIGVAAMVALSCRVPHVVPSLSFWTDEIFDTMALEKAMEIASRVMPRRGQQLDDAEVAILRYASEAAPPLGA
jgi:UDP-N-acetylglucosamine diphosphorylase/glucosamine-1-phosphate N-acetyltransferase